MTERLRILIHTSKYFQTLEIMQKTLSDKNEPTLHSVYYVACCESDCSNSNFTANTINNAAARGTLAQVTMTFVFSSATMSKAKKKHIHRGATWYT